MKDDFKYFDSIEKVAETIRPGYVCAAARLANGRIAVYGAPIEKKKEGLLSCYFQILKLAPLQKKGLVAINDQGIVSNNDSATNVAGVFSEGGY